jgi:hypothetical protein
MMASKKINKPARVFGGADFMEIRVGVRVGVGVMIFSGSKVFLQLGASKEGGP